MSKRILLSLVVAFCLFCHSRAQSLTVGDIFPDQRLPISGKKLALSELKKKLIILDFWSQRCTGCIAAFPKIDALQKEFDSSIQIILVNRESEKSTSEFFLKHKKIKKPGVLFISGDTLLSGLFPHDAEPYHVWLDSNLRIRYITDGHTATAKNIREFLNGIDLNARHVTKTRTYLPSLFDSSKFNDLSYASYFSNCRMDYHLTSFKRNDAAGLTLSCLSIEEMFQVAYNENEQLWFGFNRPGRTVLETIDSLKIRRPKDADLYTEWLDKYSFNYQLLLSKEKEKDKYRILREDLERNFNLSASIELRSVRCLTMVQTGNPDKLKTKGGKTRLNFYRANAKTVTLDSVRTLVNVPYTTFSVIIGRCIEEKEKAPFVDATGFTGNIDISISGTAMDSMDIVQLRSELRKYNLDLIEMDLPMTVLVIRAGKK